MNDFIIEIAKYSSYGFSVIIVFLILTNLYLFILKKMIRGMDSRLDHIKKELQYFNDKTNEQEYKLKRLDCSNEEFKKNCKNFKNCEVAEIGNSVKELNKKTLKLKKYTAFFKTIWDFQLWFLSTPIGKGILYLGNVDFRPNSTKKVEGQS